MTSTAPIRILVVDDHPATRLGVRSLLFAGLGRGECGEAGSGAEALRHVRSSAWHLVVLDLTLPDRSGLELLEDILVVRPATSVLVYTCHPVEAYAVRAMQAGASGYLTKEAPVVHLVEAARNILSGKRYVTPRVAELMAERLAAARKPISHEKLSNREMEVFKMLADGASVTQIAVRLSRSPKTISTLRTRILRKLGARTNVDLARYAMEKGLG